MNKSKYIFLTVILSFFILLSCNDDDNNATDPSLTAPREYQFIWSAMNSWYYWQQEEDNLADSFDRNRTEFNKFLNSFSSAEALYNDLQYKPGVVDRFSFMTDDYVSLQQSLQGIDKSFGFKYTASLYNATSNDVFAVVLFIDAGSPADQAGLKRGDIITSINGTQLTRSNFYDLIGQDNITVSLSKYENNQFVPTGTSYSLTSKELDFNPVYLTKTFDLPNNKKVGYLVYNQFVAQYNDELNAAFADLKAAGINELILDLRYNPGGSILTSSYLGSMIYGTNTSDVFSRTVYNAKHSKYNGPYQFANELTVYDANYNEVGKQTINRLNLSKIYIITSQRTASSSELIINGLDPFIDVIQVGETTVGKNVGSVTLYDSPNTDFLDSSTASNQHTYAIQPIVSQSENSLGFSDYTNGFTPDAANVINEYNYLGQWKALGDESEVLLNHTLSLICPSCRVQPLSKTNDEAFEIIGQSDMDKLGFQHFTLQEAFLE